ncbi:protein NEDD1 isoform X2 [Eutrema salsugineum]|uniref:protein NEDD1 isoform X2 n=1 Tax=Eutrema salsugineum TaxID=72664 RepID=UPI000CECE53E|nr:protein NEDD1 isoform X2 [Eutrema salsugineum]
MTMKNLVEPSWRLLAASGGDTVKLFDVSAAAEPVVDNPCVFLSYTPTPGSVVNSVKWNHTNMVVASVGEDKKISLWHKNGKSLLTVPVNWTNSSDINEECLSAINFSNKGSRYICSGGTGQTVRIWDLLRKLCIKNLKGHTSTITGVMFNCQDKHLASISVGGDLIVHNLASGEGASKLKDPNGQILKVLDYSRFSQHLLLTAGDDGTVHLWDTTGRNPKMSWLKQHSAPTAGVCFSPSNDKIIASVGLDKKLYTYDTGSRRPSSCIPYETPFSSLAFGDNGYILAAGTGNGRIVFYDVRGKPQPITVLHAYSSSEAVTSLSWQTSKPVIVNERNCTSEMALFGGTVEDSVVIPDPFPSTTSFVSHSTVLPGSHGVATSTVNLSSAEETPNRNHLWPGGPLSRLHAHRASDSLKDDMDIFSPIVGIHSGENWPDTEGLKRDHLVLDKKTSSLTFPSSSKGGFPFGDDGNKEHPINDWKLSSTSKKDDTRNAFSSFGSTPTVSSKIEYSALTPPEAWGGEKFKHLAANEKFSDKFSHLNPPLRLGVSSSSASTSGSMLSGSRDFPLSLGQNQTSLANVSISSEFPGIRDFSSKYEKYSALADNYPSSPVITKGIAAPGNIDSLRLSPSFTRRFSTYAERISTTSSFSDGAFLSFGSPKTKKTGAETREEVVNNLLQRPEKAAATDAGSLPIMNGGVSLQQSNQSETDSQRGNSFTLQLFQRTLEGTLDTFKNSIHDDMRNLHIEILRQFHMHEMEMSKALNSVLENQTELMKEIKMLRKENQQLRQML